MTDRYAPLAELHLAALRGSDGSSPTPSAFRDASTRPLRAALGRSLVRLGERLAMPSGTPVTR
jgi:hypothetical protein